MAGTLTKRCSPALWLVSSISFAAALFYLSQWLQMPLYSDEVAFRLLRSRYLADGAINFSIFPCPSNAQPIPIIFRPAAYLLSVVDFNLGWSLVRLGPLVGVLLVLVATLGLVVRQGGLAPTLMLASGLIGVAGSGLILSRGETPMLFLSVACLVGFLIVVRRYVSALARGLYLVITAQLALLALYVHVQSAILVPLLLLTAFSITVRTGNRVVMALAALTIVLVTFGTWTALNTPIHCPEYPIIESMLAKSELPGLARSEGTAGVQIYLQEKMPRYSGQFLFRSSYDANYLPGIESTPYDGWLPLLNGAIKSIVLCNLLVAGVSMIIAGGLSARVLLQRRSWQEHLASVSSAPATYLFFGLAGHLALFIDDVPTAFYRSFQIHFMLAMLNCLALSLVPGKLKMLLLPFGILCLAVSIASAVVSRTEMDTKFADGWQGAFIRLKTDWNSVRETVNQVAERCNIENADSGIIIDDLTYDAMKNRSHLIPITYLGFAAPSGASEPVAWARLLRGLSANAVVARCAFLQVYGLEPEHERDGICCVKLR